MNTSGEDCHGGSAEADVGGGIEATQMRHGHPRLQWPRGGGIRQSGLRSMKDDNAGGWIWGIWQNLVDPHCSSSNHGSKGKSGYVGELVHAFK